MAVKFTQAYGKYGIGDIAVFAPALEAQLIKQKFAKEYREGEASVADKDKKDTPPAETRKPPEGTQTRQTTVGPQKR